MDGEITKVKMSRGNTKVPLFTVLFPTKKFDKVYQGFDLDYILKHSIEVPLKYHTYKARYIIRLAKEAEEALARQQAETAGAKQADNDMEEITQSEAIEEENIDAVRETEPGPAHAEFTEATDTRPTSSKKRPNEPVGEQKKKGRPRKLQSKVSDDDDDFNGSECSDDDASEDDTDDDEATDDNNLELDENGYFDLKHWEINAMPTQPDLPFLGRSGPQHTLPVSATPYQYFCLFIPVYLWSNWVTYTNKKAEMNEENKKEGSRSYWTPLCAAELKAWVASVMVWCLFKSMSFESFFKDKVDSTVILKWFPSGWRRWHEIKMNFKVSDPTKDDEHKSDKMYKVRDLWETFIASCKANYWPTKEVGLDEAIKKFKGRCSFKQYIKNKPVRWGIKIFCVCCSATGYLWNAAFYLGKTEDSDAKQKDTSATTQAVLKILEPLASKNHIVHMDNYYTGIPLFHELSKMDIRACGTIRTNRKGLCPEVTIKKSEESQLKKKPGMIRWASYGALCFIAWFAKRPVHILTNCYLPTSTEEIGQVLHWFSEGGKKIQKLISRPPAVKWYNLFMGAVDLFDQLRSYVRLDLRCNKFWHPMFWFIVEAALVNAYVLYKATRQAEGLPLEYTHVQFRKSIALALASEWEDMGCKTKLPTAVSPTSMYKNTKVVRVHQRIEAKSDAGSRFCAPDKHLTFFTAIPLLSGSQLTKRQMKCCFCKEKRTKWWCSECTAPLCQGSCFIKFHTA